MMRNRRWREGRTFNDPVNAAKECGDKGRKTKLVDDDLALVHKLGMMRSIGKWGNEGKLTELGMLL